MEDSTKIRIQLRMMIISPSPSYLERNTGGRGLFGDLFIGNSLYFGGGSLMEIKRTDIISLVFKKLYSEDNNQSKLILVGSMSIILLQTLIHIGVNINFLPTTGMTLPFLSYGGSSIVSTAILAGIILNLTKRKLN